MAGKTILEIESGVKAYSINGKYDLEINPTDSAFVEKLYDTFEKLDKNQDAYKAEIEKAEKREIFDIARRRDAEMREMIDGIFGDGCCQAVFGGMNLYALGNGLPVWANLLLAVMDEIDTSFSNEQQRANPRLEKYKKKYHR